jgi:hypothetical protein
MRLRVVVISLLFIYMVKTINAEVLIDVSTDTWGFGNESRVVYLDYTYLNGVNYYTTLNSVTLSNKQKTKIIPSDNSLPYYIGFCFSGERLAYIPYYSNRSVAGNSTLNIYNFSTQNSQRIVSDTTYKEMVWIKGNIVVWVDYRHKTGSGQDSVNSEIYMYDLSTNTEKRLTNDHAYQCKPSTDGQNIIWLDYSVKGQGKVFLYTVADSKTIEIDPSDAGKDNPKISGNHIVWEDYRLAGTNPQNADIYLYSISEKKSTNICNASGFQGQCDINDSFVVWEDYRSQATNSSDIYCYTIQNGATISIAATADYEANPTLYNSKLIWFKLSSTVNSKTLNVTDLNSVSIKKTDSRISGKLTGSNIIYNSNQITVYRNKNEKEDMDFSLNTLDGKHLKTWTLKGINSSQIVLTVQPGLARGTYILNSRFNGSTIESIPLHITQ